MYANMKRDERDARAIIGSDQCVIDQKCFLIRGCLEIPITGCDEPLLWGSVGAKKSSTKSRMLGNCREGKQCWSVQRQARQLTFGVSGNSQPETANRN